jgi:hypothetical protein
MATSLPSARHQAALATPTSYRRWVRCTFYREGIDRVLEPISGRLTQDARRKARWDGQLTFASNDIIPTKPGDLLTPFGTRVRAELGIELLDGAVSYVPYGEYEISSSKARVEANQRVVDVGLIDMSNRVERYRFETPVTVNAGVTLPDMINYIFINRTGRNPGVDASSTALGANRIFGLDTATAPWAEILDVLSSFSLTAWFDRTGRVRMGALVPDATTSYELDDLTSFSADFDVWPPNVIVARGEAQDGTAPVQAVAIDEDPSSPTYAGTGPGTSPYGRVTQYFSSPLLLTTGQAQSAANTILAQNIGGGSTYALTRPFDPTLDAGDVVTLPGDTGLLAIDSITVEMTGDTTIQVRGLS